MLDYGLVFEQVPSMLGDPMLSVEVCNRSHSCRKSGGSLATPCPRFDDRGPQGVLTDRQNLMPDRSAWGKELKSVFRRR